jgi:hypothetical protein
MERSKRKYRLILSALGAFIFSSLVSGAALAESDADQMATEIKLRAEQRCEEMLDSNGSLSEVMNLTEARRKLIELNAEKHTRRKMIDKFAMKKEKKELTEAKKKDAEQRGKIDDATKTYQTALSKFLAKLAGPEKQAANEKAGASMTAALSNLMIEVSKKDPKREDVDAAISQFEEAKKSALMEGQKKDGPGQNAIASTMTALANVMIEVSKKDPKKEDVAAAMSKLEEAKKKASVEDTKTESAGLNAIASMMTALANVMIEVNKKDAKKEDVAAAMSKLEEAKKEASMAASQDGADKKMTVPENMKAAPNEMLENAVKSAAGNIRVLESDMAGLQRIWADLGKYERKNGSDLILARKNIANCAERIYLASVSNEKMLGTPAADSAVASIAQDGAKLIRDDFVSIAQRSVSDSADLSLFIGPSFALDGKDKFNTGFEVRAQYDGGAGSFFNWGRVLSDFSYQTKGTVNQARGADGTITQPAGADLFLSNKGYIRFDTGVSTRVWGSDNQYYAATLVGGLTTIPGRGGDFPEALRPRVAIGVIGRTFLTDGIYTRLTASIAHDEYWRTDVTETVVPATATTPAQLTTRRLNSYERGTIEANVLLPAKTGGGKFSAALRLLLDTPLDGKGPSEVRLSLLASMNFNDVFSKIVKASP